MQYIPTRGGQRYVRDSFNALLEMPLGLFWEAEGSIKDADCQVHDLGGS